MSGLKDKADSVIVVRIQPPRHPAPILQVEGFPGIHMCMWSFYISLHNASMMHLATPRFGSENLLAIAAALGEWIRQRLSCRLDRFRPNFLYVNLALLHGIRDSLTSSVRSKLGGILV